GALHLFDLGGETVDDLLVDDDRQDAILKTIGEEDVAKAGADHRADAAFLQCAHRAFAGGAAAEIGPGDEDLRLAIGLAVEDEFGVFRSIRQTATRAERPFAERAAN